MKAPLIVNYFVTLFMLCSPLTAIPVFLSLTQGRDKKERRTIGITSGIAVAIILPLTTWIGAPFLAFLGIRIEAFQCAGGIIVFLLALSMLNAQISPMRHSEEETKTKAPSVSVVPLAIPIMAGPGALSGVIVASNTYASFADHIILSFCGIGVGIVAAILLCFALPMERKLGSSGLNIVTRIGGLILAALAIEIFVQGLEGLKVL
ncbi:MAG: NAAT family transporter [Simkania sp.]|nr:NAAT family transporter [Simkania sp.]